MMQSQRLRYLPLEPEAVGAFHGLVQDEHIRRYLMDGTVFPLEWSEERVNASRDSFSRMGVGLWLAYELDSGALVGFCGFLEIPELHPAPQLVYALTEPWTGRGYATEMARTVIDAARARGFSEIIAGVDAVNGASVRVLEKLGFVRFGTHPGSFGDAHLLRLDLLSRE